MTDGERSPELLVVWHSRTGASEAMAKAAAEAGKASLVRAADVEPDDLFDAAGYIFVAPENLASLSGEMKEMFDRTYYPMLGRIEGRPYASIIAAGSDGENAQRQLDRIVTGWRLKRIADPIIVNFSAQLPEEILARKQVPQADVKRCQELGAGFAEGLRLGIM